MTTTPQASDPVEVVSGVMQQYSSRHGFVPAPVQAAVTPTQVRRPWRSTVRTVVAFLIGAAALAPEIYHEATQQDPAAATGWAAVALAIAGGVTRVLANARVETLLRRFWFSRWLAAAPPPTT